MPRPAVARGERAVGDLADERLDERVLAALGRARVADPEQDVAPDERAQARLRGLGSGSPADRGQRTAVKLWPRTAASWSSARSAGLERIEARGDERVERLRHGQLVRSPTGS